VSARENGLANSLSLSPSRTLVTPYCKRIRPGRRTTRRPQFPLVVFPPLCSVSRRPIWAGTRSDNLLVGPGTPRGRNADTVLPCWVRTWAWCVAVLGLVAGSTSTHSYKHDKCTCMKYQWVIGFGLLLPKPIPVYPMGGDFVPYSYP
jgi:hypothetical protein